MSRNANSISLRGVLLAGGKSSRFGTDKARAPLPDGRPLILGLIDLLKTFDPEPLLIADRCEKYRDLKLASRTDIIAARGPLGGLHAALSTITTAAALVVTCDMPALDEATVSVLAENLNADDDAVVYVTSDGIQPFPGIYARRTLPALVAFLNAGRGSAREFIATLGRVRTLIAISQTPFLNMNTRADHESFLATAQIHKEAV